MTQQPTICLIHGHGVDASIWNDIYADLAVEFPVLQPDMARLTNHTTIEAYAEDLNARLQEKSVSDMVLIGHSMGGYIALAFAERYPAMIRGLILYHSTAYADDDDRKAQRRQTIETIKAEGAAQFIEKQLPKMVSPAYPAQQTQALIDRFRNLPADALVAGLEAIASRPDRTHVLRDAQFPVLLVLGSQDQLIPLDKTQQLTQLSSKISVSVIENAGHLSMVEKPEAALNALRNFIKQTF